MNLMTLKHIPQQSGMCFRFLICGLLLWSAPALQMAAEKTAEPPVEAIDSVIGLLTDSLADGMEAGMEPRFSSLTEEDYRQVAEELGVEVAAIKAVVDIEAGPQHKGFWQPGKPLINFDLSMYRCRKPGNVRRKSTTAQTQKNTALTKPHNTHVSMPPPQSTQYPRGKAHSGACSRSEASTGANAEPETSKSLWQ